MRWWALVIVFAAASTGCFKPSYESGKFQCSAKGECPSGFSCVSGTCYAPGMGPDLATSGTMEDLAGVDLPPPEDLIQIDLVPPVIVVAPAAVWTSSGGGTSSASSGATLGLSVGGSVVGSPTAQGTSNATLTFGKLGTAR